MLRAREDGHASLVAADFNDIGCLNDEMARQASRAFPIVKQLAV